jgi:hypothetical protein
MATITVQETGVKAIVLITREDDGSVHLLVQAQSILQDGSVHRTIRRNDITQDVTPATLNGATNLLTTVENRLKQLWEIT